MSDKKILVPERESSAPPPYELRSKSKMPESAKQPQKVPPRNCRQQNPVIQKKVVQLQAHSMDARQLALARQSAMEYIIAATDSKVGPAPRGNAKNLEATKIRQERDDYMKKLGAGRGLTLEEIKADEKEVRNLLKNGKGIVQDTISNPDGSILSTFSSFSTSNSDFSAVCDQSFDNDEVDVEVESDGSRKNDADKKKKVGSDQVVTSIADLSSDGYPSDYESPSTANDSYSLQMRGGKRLEKLSSKDAHSIPQTEESKKKDSKPRVPKRVKTCACKGDSNTARRKDSVEMQKVEVNQEKRCSLGQLIRKIQSEYPDDEQAAAVVKENRLHRLKLKTTEIKEQTKLTTAEKSIKITAINVFNQIGEELIQQSKSSIHGDAATKNAKKKQDN